LARELGPIWELSNLALGSGHLWHQLALRDELANGLLVTLCRSGILIYISV